MQRVPVLSGHRDVAHENCRTELLEVRAWPRRRNRTANLRSHHAQQSRPPPHGFPDRPRPPGFARHATRLANWSSWAWASRAPEEIDISSGASGRGVPNRKEAVKVEPFPLPSDSPTDGPTVRLERDRGRWPTQTQPAVLPRRSFHLPGRIDRKTCGEKLGLDSDPGVADAEGGRVRRACPGEPSPSRSRS